MRCFFISSPFFWGGAGLYNLTSWLHELVIRADASEAVGAGHVMRCMALARAWRDRGGAVTFASCCRIDAIRRRILDEGFDFAPIESPHPAESDARRTMEMVHSKSFGAGPGKKGCESVAWIVLDGYHFDAGYQKTIRESGCRLMVIDDLNHCPEYWADILLNQNYGAENRHYVVRPDAKLLAGSRYVMLRDEFSMHDVKTRRIPERATNIVATLGGSDVHNITLKVIQALKRIDRGDLKITIVVGPANSRMRRYQDAVSDFLSETRLEFAVDDMSGLLLRADAAIICAGGTLWECLCMGCPAISLAGNEIQHSILTDLGEKDIVFYAGRHENATEKALAGSIEKVLSSARSRTFLSKNGPELIDGKGAARVVRSMIEFENPGEAPHV